MHIPSELGSMGVIAVLWGEHRKQVTATQTKEPSRDIHLGVLFPGVMECPLHITSLAQEIFLYGAGSLVYTVLQCKMQGENKDIYVNNRTHQLFLNLEIER